MERSLFRSEVVAESGQQWLGVVRLSTPVSSRFWTWSAVCVSLMILCWLCMGHYTRRVHVTGVLVPKAGLIGVTATFQGVVERVAVLEGQKVNAGDTLVLVSGERASESLGNTGAKVSTQLGRQSESLRQDILDATSIQEKQTSDNFRQQRMLKGQVDQIDAAMAIQKKQIELARGLIEKWSSLVDKGYISSFQVEQEQSALLSDESQFASLKQQRFSVMQQLEALNDQVEQIPLNTSAHLNDLRRQLSQVEQSLDQNEATRVGAFRAPSSGVVSSVTVKEGGSVVPGEVLLSIVPEGSPLQAQLLVPSQSVGFIRPGSEVALHYQSFPYQKFGLHTGVVRSVSRSALSPSEVGLLLGGAAAVPTEPLYLVRVEPKAQSVMAYGRNEPLRPGMSLEADVLLDRRRVVEWIFEPLYGMGHRWWASP